MNVADMTEEEWQETNNAFFNKRMATLGPTAEEAATAKSDAEGLLCWLEGELAKNRNRADMAQEFEELLFRTGSLRMMWAMRPDECLRYRVKRYELLKQAGPEVTDAVWKAEERERGERAALFGVVYDMRMKADELDSERLQKVADVVESMIGFSRVEPDGPAKEARSTGAKKAAEAKHAPTGKLKERIVAECLNYKKGTQWKNPAARKVAPIAFEWNKEAGSPFTWLDVAAAERQIRRWLAKL